MKFTGSFMWELTLMKIFSKQKEYILIFLLIVILEKMAQMRNTFVAENIGTLAYFQITHYFFQIIMK